MTKEEMESLLIRPWVFDMNLKLRELVLYARIHHLSEHGTKFCNIDVEETCKMLRCHPQALQPLLNAMIKNGFLFRTDENKYKTILPS